MSKKLIFIGTVVFILVGIASIYFLTPKSVICKNYALDEAHKITDKSKIPQGTWNNMTTPQGSKLEIIELIKPKGLDATWRRAMYSKEENVFWVIDDGGDKHPNEQMSWYGPFEGKPCLW